ncbi:hypothetical protein C8A00DRAFT_30243 [Chaetomidium leptoderma]|uniref:Casein kinase II beta 2 subunit n=1 Tax=Chaetomidium leptoderma TaxID=669021 RepID=A0AAN6ZYP4_9PEZI|nr:hypothetical protein C8A00DRAFT_30243 [Chaetomidium leptoderma]
MFPAGGIWAPAALRALRKHLVNNTQMATKMLRTKLSAATRSLNTELQPIAVRTGNARQPIHPAAWLRQQKRAGGTKWFSSANFNATARRFISTGGHAGPKPGFRFDRSKFPTSNISRAVSQLTGRTPFTSTLRPNLTGGTLGRTAGGYGIPGAGRIGGVRHFSHTPAAPAQVVQNVSQAMRAFWLSGHRARFDGVGPDGEKRYRAVSATQEEARVRMDKAMRAFRPTPGAFVDFKISPTITALSPLGVMMPFMGEEEKGAADAATLCAEGFLDVLSVDFARALKDLAAIMTDLKSLAGLGDLPVLLEKNNVLRVRFPGMDAETVERLCDDVGIRRGVVGQDLDFDTSPAVEVALRFPFAPDKHSEDTMTSPGGSLRSHRSEASSSDIGDAFIIDEFEENPWQLSSGSEPEGYGSMSPPIMSSSGEYCAEDFEGLEGIYRFLEECDRARGRF